MRSRVGICGLLLVLGCGVPLHAAEEVVLTYKDGRKEKVELASYDAEQIVVRVKVGKNLMDVKVPWDKVQDLSNGLTAERVREKWREENMGKLCAACEGARTVACEKCAGEGKLVKERVPCAACKGEGVLACKGKDCEKGKVPCPEPCIKKGVGEWVTGKDGNPWRRYRFGGQFVEWSEGHIGELVLMEDGKPANKGNCPTCNRTTRVDCAACKGAGTQLCADCKGEKTVPKAGAAPDCPDCEGGKAVCKACKGKGLKE